MHFKSLLWFLAAGLLLSAGMSAAQDTTETPAAPAPTLRDLAARDNFYIGAAVGFQEVNDAHYSSVLAREFNMLTPENEAKACSIEPQIGRFEFHKFDTIVAFAEAHDMKVHGHTLVWHQCVPSWLQNGKFTREEAIGLLRDHIYTEVGRYKGRVAIWDVVNEAIDDDNGLREAPWHTLIGDDYVELAFRFAHEADPDALLFYNDYNIEAVNAKSDAVYAMVQDFIKRGVPINGIGLQSHFEIGTVNAPSIARNIQRFGMLGLQVQMTEVDVRYDGDTTDAVLQRQARDYGKLMSTCLDSPFCTAFITWGLTDRFSWLRGSDLGFFENETVAPLMFDQDYQEKPAYFAVRDLLAKKVGVTLPDDSSS